MPLMPFIPGQPSAATWDADEYRTHIVRLHENRARAAMDLARLLSKEFSMVITSEAVLNLFDNKWEALSKFSHAIHEGRGR